MLGDDTVVRAVGCGTVRFDRESMQPMLLRDVLYVPGMKKNLVSVTMIEDKGVGVYVLDGKVYIFPKAEGPSASYVIGVRCRKLYKLLFQPHHALEHTQSNNELRELWHMRMTHLHHLSLRMPRDMTIGLQYFSTEQSCACIGCALGKYTKTTCLSSDNILEGVLDLIHSDLCGPISFASLTGFEYYITFIDDFSRKTWIYFLRSKKLEEVLLRFQEFKAILENQT